MDTLHERLRRVRRERDLTQQELADRCGVNRVSIWRIEKKHRSPSSEMLNSISQALGVSADFLLRGDSERHAN
jgi:transcriptional regulator with XRE-family HTH domain